MPFRPLLSLGLLLLVCAAAARAQVAPAQTPPPADARADAVAAFNAAAAEHGREYLRFIQRKTSVRESFAKLEDVFQAPHFDAVTLDDLTATLGRRYRPGTAVLFYAYTEPNLSVWLIDAGGVRAYSRRPVTPAELARANDDLRGAMRIGARQAARAPRLRGLDWQPDRAAPAADLRQARARATELLLPAPVAAALAPVTDLIIVPVLNLGTVPFALLRPFRSDEPLVARAVLYLAPSLFELKPEMGAWSPVFRAPLIIGNPAFTDKARWYLPPLQGAEREAAAIARRFSTQPLTGPAATKAVVIPRARAADLLYFATHGVADPADSRQGSFLALSADGADLGLWTMAEILEQRFQARLAVLSACQTGLGETYKGGVMALGRTFQVAGVPRVVMSLWNVDDAATARLMLAFTSYLGAEPPAAALRHAMLDESKAGRDPALWAPFVFFGTPERLP